MLATTVYVFGVGWSVTRVLVIDIAPVGEGFCKVGVQADGLAEVGDGPVPLAFTFVGKAPVGEGDGEILAGETPRLNVPSTGNDSDVGMVATEVTPLNFLREIRLSGLCPCGQKEDGEGYVSDNISPCCRGISAFQMDKSSRIGITNATGEVFGRGPSALAALSGRPERGALRQWGRCRQWPRTGAISAIEVAGPCSG